jgi:hypothetical protein
LTAELRFTARPRRRRTELIGTVQPSQAALETTIMQLRRQRLRDYSSSIH